MSVVSEVFTAILNKRLYSWAETEGKSVKSKQDFANIIPQLITFLLWLPS